MDGGGHCGVGGCVYTVKVIQDIYIFIYKCQSLIFTTSISLLQLGQTRDATHNEIFSSWCRKFCLAKEGCKISNPLNRFPSSATGKSAFQDRESGLP